MVQKVLIANNVGTIWASAMATAAPSVLGSWLGIVAFALQIYFDFSGYSDMAIGLGRMFGFHLPENFCFPVHLTVLRSEFFGSDLGSCG